MKQVILGTAGHIDHGKTSLIKALTGIDTDRLKEEKLRGITIELGFAYMDLPGGNRLGIVDVPGHERFVKHMVAGATGIDLVALIIAADEGVMPQTREHMEICQLLKVKKGIVVLTKIDLVDDPDWLEMVREDVAEFLKGTFLDGAPIVSVSSVTGEGMELLRTTLIQLYEEVEPRNPEGPFRLPVDRVFTIRGFGTVVTGTSTSGSLRIGDPVTIYPSGLKSKVRGLQVHGMEVREVLPGQRTAVNLQGMERALIERGDVVATPGTLAATHMVDVQMELLASSPRPLKHRAKIRFHTGTAEHIATAVLLDRAELAPGDQAFAQIRLDHPIAALRGDRFVVRSYSPVRTIGGGTILDPLPRKHKGHQKREAAAALRELFEGGESDAVLWHIRRAEWAGLSADELQIRANLTPKVLEACLQDFVKRKAITLFDKENHRFIEQAALRDLKKSVLDILTDYHKRFPLKTGMPKEELLAQLTKPVDVKMYNFTLRELTDSGLIVQDMEWVSVASHRTDLSDEEQAVRQRIEKTFKDSGLQPPFLKEAVSGISGSPRLLQDVLQWMVSRGILIKVKEEIYFHADALAGLQLRLIAFLKEHGEISTSDFKEMTQVSRKYTIPLLEYFDSQKITIRIGDARRLRETRSST